MLISKHAIKINDLLEAWSSRINTICYVKYNNFHQNHQSIIMRSCENKCRHRNSLLISVHRKSTLWTNVNDCNLYYLQYHLFGTFFFKIILLLGNVFCNQVEIHLWFPLTQQPTNKSMFTIVDVRKVVILIQIYFSSHSHPFESKSLNVQCITSEDV